MEFFKGNTASRASKMVIGQRNIRYFVITNKSLNPVIVNVMIKLATGEEINISPMDQHLKQGQSYTDNDIVLDDREHIVLTVANGNVDYYFLIEDLNETYLKQW